MLKRLGWTRVDAQEFIVSAERRLEDMEIEVEWTPEVKLDRYTPSNGQTKEGIEKYKPYQEEFHQSHDFAAIDKIIELRRRPVRNIEDARCVFLSSDRRLAKYSHKQMGHRDDGSVAEVVFDQLLTNILWLKNPTAKIALQSLIATYSGGLVVSKRVWKAFYNKLKELRARGEVRDEQISALFYSNYIGGILSQVDESQLDSKMTDDFVVSTVEEADARKGKDFEEKEQELIRRLQEERSAAEIERDRQLAERIGSIRANLGKSSEKTASRLSKVIAGCVTAVIIVAVVRLESIIVPIVSTSAYYFVPSIAVGSGGIVAIWKKTEGAVRRKVRKIIFQRKLSEAGIEP